MTSGFGVVVVTGAGSGIGQATAKAFARVSRHVVCLDVDATAAAATAAACGSEHGKASAVTVDVADRAAVLAAAEQVVAAHGAPDVLVNNAGVGLSGHFLDTGLEDWDWILGVNLVGVVHCCYGFGGAMVERGSGQVINVASGLAYTYRATESAYITTKAGVLALSRSLRVDWAAAGVGVSAVCPGLINTPIVRHTRFRGERGRPDQVAKVQRAFSRGHPPEAVARAIVRAAHRNPAVVPVGFEAWLGWIAHRMLPAGVNDSIAGASDRYLGTRS